jgi:PilZ domain
LRYGNEKALYGTRPNNLDGGRWRPELYTEVLCIVNSNKQERRRTPRYAFSAIAEVIDGSGAVIRSQVSDISVSGCRLIVNRCLVVGAEVKVRIHTPTDHFQTWAMVVHSTPSDMGLVFHSTDPMFLTVLQKWANAARSAEASVEG